MVFQTPVDARDQFFTFSSGETETRRREHSGYLLSQNSEQMW